MGQGIIYLVWLINLRNQACARGVTAADKSPIFIFMEKNTVPVSIVGGGMVGLTTAVALAEAGLKVAVVDALDPTRQMEAGQDGRVSALAYGSRLFLEKLGIWEYLEPYTQPINDIRVVDEGSPVTIHYDHQMVGTEPMGYIAENRHIRQAIARRAQALPAIRLIAPARWRHVAPSSTGVEVTLQDDSALQSELLIVADGKFSKLRQALGIEITQKDYQQTALVATIEHAYPHEGLALERFFPAGPFAVLPMCENKSSLVWVESHAHAACYAKLDKATQEAEIQRRIGGYLGDISLVSSLFHYPLCLVLPERLYGMRAALVGDAAHGIHPIAGQGLNLGLRDVEVLVEKLIAQAKLGLDLGQPDLLQSYHDARQVDITSMVLATDGINGLFSNHNPLLKLARNIGFYGVEQSHTIKRRFIRHAMGLPATAG
jgi:2-octaprenyl-6-methoxyphenol hydroxylase